METTNGVIPVALVAYTTKTNNHTRFYSCILKSLPFRLTVCAEFSLVRSSGFATCENVKQRGFSTPARAHDGHERSGDDDAVYRVE
jgi:hypothetical protein